MRNRTNTAATCSNRTLLRGLLGVCSACLVVFWGSAYAQLPKGIVVEKVEAKPDEDEPAAPYLSLNIDGHTAVIKSLTFSPDSKTLYSAGQDKVVHAWRFGDGRAKAFVVEPRGWHKSHSIRWEIARSVRGTIYAVAASPDGRTVSIGGVGARGTTGDIVFSEAEAGTIKSIARGMDVTVGRIGHSDTIAGLSYSSDGKWLVSTDIWGKSILWDLTRAPLRGRVIQDDVRVGRMTWEAFAGRSRVVVRRFKELKEAGGRSMATFGIDYYDVNTGKSVGWIPNLTLYKEVTALAASRDGRMVAVCDAARRLYLYKTGDREAIRLNDGLVARSLCFSNDGRYLAVGTMAEGGNQPQVHVWDTVKKERIFARGLQRSVTSVALSPNGQWLACNGGESHHVFVWQFDGRGGLIGERTTLLSGGDRIVSVKPSDRKGNFQVQFRTNTKEERVFDPVAIKDDPVIAIPKAIVVEPVVRETWTLEVQSAFRLQLKQSGVERGFIQLHPEKQGGIATADSYCFIHDRLGRSIAVAIGTDTSNEVFVYNLPARGECAMVRRFRGHSADVNALSVTADRRYLVTGSADGTVRYWKLQGLTENKFISRWGVEVKVTKDGSGLEVTRCDDSGPLFQKGVRVGDVITKVIWPEDESGKGRHLSTVKPDLMFRELHAQPWSKQFGIVVRRGDDVWEPFNVTAGWHHLLAVFVHRDEWIAWHPSGYYACSPGGQKLIGWQVNEDLGNTPRMFPAVQFRDSLYRPLEVSNLLTAGGLEKPDAAVSRPPSPPLVQLLSPDAGEVEHDKETIVIRARARATGAEPLVKMQLYKDGLPGEVHFMDAREQAVGDMGWVEREWTVPLEEGVYRFSVRADTASCHGFSYSSRVAYKPARATRTLHLITIAVNDYDEVSDLRFCVNDAARIAKIFASRGGLFDQVRTTTIFNEDATKQGILAAFDATVEQAGKDDLVLLFYSGHGYQVDDRFFMVSSNAKRLHSGEENAAANLKNLTDRCVSEDDIKDFCKRLGRKACSMLIMLDACHSGAVNLTRLTNELGTNDYKVAMMASSKGDEFSYEHEGFANKKGGGAFTEALWLGMYLGEAENPMVSDRQVDLDELHPYVRRKVKDLIKGIAKDLEAAGIKDPRQTPISNFNTFDDPIALTLLPE